MATLADYLIPPEEPQQKRTLADYLIPPKGPSIQTAPSESWRGTIGAGVRTVGSLVSGALPTPVARALGGAGSETAAQLIEGPDARESQAINATLPPPGQMPEDSLLSNEELTKIAQEVRGFSPLKAAAMGAVTAVGPGRMPGYAGIAREAAVGAGSNAVLAGAEGRMPTAEELAMGTAFGIVGGAANARYLEGSRARTTTLAEADNLTAQFRSRPPGADFTPPINQPEQPSTLLGPTGRPIGEPETPPTLIAPGAQPNPSARLVSPSGKPFPADSETVLRETVTRRGFPEEEINQIVKATAPPSTPGPEVARADFLQGKPRTVGGDLLAKEEQQALTQGISSAMRQGPPESGPTVLPFRKGEKEALRSPFTDSVRAAGRTDTDPALDFWQVNNQRGSILTPVVKGLARGAAGGIAGAAVPADTEEERLRNAAIGAVGFAAGPPLISSILGRKPQAMTEIDNIAQDFGKVARDVEYKLDQWDLKLAHQVADGAMADIEKIAARAHEVSPDNRLFRVVADTLMAPGAQKENNLGTVTNAGQLLQRYSALAQKLTAMADAGDADAGKLLNQLYGSKDADLTRKIVNFWRGSLVGRVATGLRNAGDASAMLATTMLDRVATGVVKGFREGKPIQETATGAREAYTLGATAAKRAAEGFAEFTHLAAKQPKLIDALMDAFPEEKLRLMMKPEGLEGKLGKYLEFANWTNNIQENFFRRVISEAELRNGLRKAGLDVEQALANPNTIPDAIISKAVDQALKGTMVYKPDGVLGKAVGLFFSQIPIAHLAVPFPRYMANRMVYLMEHSPLGFLRLATVGAKRGKLEQIIAENTDLLEQGGTVASKATFNVERATSKLARLDSNDEIIGKALTGTIVPLVAGFTLRNSEFAGEHWWQTKDPTSLMGGEKGRLDWRPFATAAVPMFLGELVKQIATQGKITMSAEDIKQGIGLLGMRSGVGLTLVDTLSGRGDMSYEGWLNLAADLAAMVPSGFFNPISQVKDIAAALGSTEEATQRDWRDTPAMRLYGPSANTFPFTGRLLPKRYSPTNAGPVTNEFPVARFFGMNVTKPNAIEREIARTGLPRESLYPREERRADTRAILRGQGRYVEQEGGRLMQDPEYRALPRSEKIMELKRLLSTGRREGLAALPEQRIADILRRRKPEELQQMMRGE